MDTAEGYKNDTNQLKQDTQRIVDTFNANVQQKTTDFNNNAISKIKVITALYLLLMRLKNPSNLIILLWLVFVLVLKKKNKILETL